MTLSMKKIDESDTAGGLVGGRADMDLDFRPHRGGGSIEKERVWKILRPPMGAMAAVTQQYSV
jgi:hypothetical protein